MVHRWACPHCDFVAWAPDKSVLGNRVLSHVTNHHRSAVNRSELHFAWECPYCTQAQRAYDEEAGMREFGEHLFSHIEPMIEEGRNIADEINSSGDILVISPPASARADDARIQFVASCEIAVLVTRNPAARLRLFENRLTEPPARMVVVTTEGERLQDQAELDDVSLPVGVVTLDSTFRLAGLGETLSQIINEHESADGRISVQFDILDDLLANYPLQDVFRFLHALSARLADADALAHHYLDENAESDSTVNMLAKLYDLTIRTSGNAFMAVT